eukprot:715530-Rhodomonas_salina.1
MERIISEIVWISSSTRVQLRCQSFGPGANCDVIPLRHHQDVVLVLHHHLAKGPFRELVPFVGSVGEL